MVPINLLSIRKDTASFTSNHHLDSLSPVLIQRRAVCRMLRGSIEEGQGGETEPIGGLSRVSPMSLAAADQTTKVLSSFCTEEQSDWMAPLFHDGYQSNNRQDRVTRATALSMITDLMLNEAIHPSDAVDFLEDLESSCQKDGVSLPELLAENMSTGDVPPLMWEIQRCRWREEPELLMFLVIRTLRAKVPWMIRTACQAVGDNSLMQVLRETLEPDVVCHLNWRDVEFDVSVTVKSLASKLDAKTVAWTSVKTEQDIKILATPVVEPRSVNIEWLVEERAWALELKTDAVELTLLEGPPAVVTASLYVEPPTKGNSAQDCYMEFPSPAVLLPISRAGRNSLIVKPAWRPESWGEGRDSGEAVSFQLRVKLEHVDHVAKEKVEKEEEAVKSGLEAEDDWVIEDDDGEPVLAEEAEEANPGWVLASYTGKDEDVEERTDKK
ncbi:hypothetical protein FRB90_005463 [Tulasnella sp. 427]|nr:hypothetical protein FRB90_005463 [Tulasnella sp. 427]